MKHQFNKNILLLMLVPSLLMGLDNTSLANGKIFDKLSEYGFFKDFNYLLKKNIKENEVIYYIEERQQDGKTEVLSRDR